MVTEKKYICRFYPTYTNVSMDVFCDFLNSALLLQNWFTTIGVKSKVIESYNLETAIGNVDDPLIENKNTGKKEMRHLHECLKCKMSPESKYPMILVEREVETRSIRDTGYCTDCLIESE